jgi:hypothetical protein
MLRTQLRFNRIDGVLDFMSGFLFFFSLPLALPVQAGLSRFIR